MISISTGPESPLTMLACYIRNKCDKCDKCDKLQAEFVAKNLSVKEGTLQLAQYKGFLPSLKNAIQPGPGDEAGTHANRVGGRMT
jgi:hypothetical protein